MVTVLVSTYPLIAQVPQITWRRQLSMTEKVNKRTPAATTVATSIEERCQVYLLQRTPRK